MNESNVTKKELSIAFKELLEEKTFSSITISDICKKKGMNRKSFYYHFKDKYDLVNWIFYTDFKSKLQSKNVETEWDMLDELCLFFYENKDFYRKTFRIEGQNSFSEYFHEIISIILKRELENIFSENEFEDFYVDFYTDGFYCAIKRWILEREDMDNIEFCKLIKKCMIRSSIYIVDNENNIN